MKEIEERALELKKPQIAPKEALARMTELSALLKTKIDPVKMARQEELMRGLGQQFVGNPYLGAFGQQLKRSDYQQAAKPTSTKWRRMFQSLTERNDRTFPTH